MKRLLLCTLFAATGCGTGVQQQESFVGVVAAATPEASDAGRRVLEAGGNAVDAAVAVSFALSVSEPAMSGLGGQTQILMFSPKTGGVVINGTSFAPRATPPDAVKDDLDGRRATTVPTTLKVLDYAYRRYGSGRLSWSDLVAPAVEYAEDGVVLGAFRRKVLARHVEELLRDEPTAALFGTFPTGDADRFRQPVLAQTLRRIAVEGAEVFYRGEMAHEIAADMERHGGWIRYEDLAELADPVEIAPLRTSYRGYEVLSLPPPGGGWVVLQMLEMLETFDAGELEPGSPSRVQALVRVLHHGHRERRRNPVTSLTDYDVDIEERLSPETVGALVDDGRGETTHFSIVDGEGTAVSVTASINGYYGARVAHPDLGFLYNDYMKEFEVGRPEHPFNLHAGAMPFSSMSPTILTKDGHARLVLGSPGSARILSAVTQVTQLWVDAGLTIEEAVSYPRLHVQPEAELFVETPERFAREIDELTAAGFVLTAPAMDLANERGNPYFGGVHAVALENGVWVGAADPRRDGSVATAIVER